MNKILVIVFLLLALCALIQHTRTSSSMAVSKWRISSAGVRRKPIEYHIDSRPHPLTAPARIPDDAGFLEVMTSRIVGQ